MKLKAVIEDPKLFCDLLELCRSTQQTNTLCVQASTLRIFSCTEAADAVQVWVDCRTSLIFREFRCQSPYNDSLVCDILDTPHLCHVLRSAEKLKGEGYEREVRLSKGASGPLLKMAFRSHHGGLKSERYDVSIRLRSQEELNGLSVPSLEEGESIHLSIPRVSELIHFIESSKAARCSRISFKAVGMPDREDGHEDSTNGSSMCQLRMEAPHDYGILSIQYVGVTRRPPIAMDDEEEGLPASQRMRIEPLQEAEVVISLKRFAPLAAAMRLMELSDCSVHIAHQKALVICFRHSRAASAAVYIPAVASQDVFNACSY